MYGRAAVCTQRERERETKRAGREELLLFRWELWLFYEVLVNHNGPMDVKHGRSRLPTGRHWPLVSGF